MNRGLEEGVQINGYHVDKVDAKFGESRDIGLRSRTGEYAAVNAGMEGFDAAPKYLGELGDVRYLDRVKSGFSQDLPGPGRGDKRISKLLETGAQVCDPSWVVDAEKRPFSSVHHRCQSLWPTMAATRSENFSGLRYCMAISSSLRLRALLPVVGSSTIP